MPRRIEQYKWKRKTNLASWNEVWGPILTDVDLRIAALEQLGELNAQTLVDTIYAYAINLLNTNFAPLIVDAQQRLANLGVSFAANSTTPIDLPPSGQVALTMPEAVAVGYVPVDYVSCRSAADQSNQFLGQVAGFQRELTEDFTSASNLSVADVVSFGVKQAIPSYLPTTGKLHVGTREIEYTEYTGMIFTIVPTDFSGAYAVSENAAVHVNYGELLIDVVTSEGTGTYSDWLIRVAAPPNIGHDQDYNNPHRVTAALLGYPAGSAPAYTQAETYSRAEITAAILAKFNEIPPFDDSPLLKKALNLSDLTNKSAARDNLELKTLALYDQISWNQLVNEIKASAADFIANSANKLLNGNAVWNAAAYKTLTDASIVTPDLGSVNGGINFSWTFTSGGGVRTLGYPINANKYGQSGYFDIKQHAAGGTTLGFQAGFTFDNGVPPSIDLGANRITQLGYHLRAQNDTRIYLCSRGAR